MSGEATAYSTGLDSLDRVLQGLLPGDNIVWMQEDIEDYALFADPFCRAARERDRPLVYFRFATEHRPLLPKGFQANVVQLNPQMGFEAFVTSIHRVIDDYGASGYFLFDRLSHLVADWYSDRMLGNFFQLICPYVLNVEGLACFALRKGYHSIHATGPIANTTQILINVHRYNDALYIQPMKVESRYQPSMFTLHRMEDDVFIPITSSDTIAEVLTSNEWSEMTSDRLRLDVWHRVFQRAEHLAEVAAGQEDTTSQAVQSTQHQLLRMAVTREEPLQSLARRHFTLLDVLQIGRRMIGTGLIGGKAVGMLLARAILRSADPQWGDILEHHDSFYIGSDVFYTYLVQNGVWWLRERQRHSERFMDGAEEAREKIRTGEFSPGILKAFGDMLDYYGQSPIIVRSSSLLEDNFGNAFSGKYESVFCPNQGTPEERLERFLEAVRTIYASTMSAEALEYRARRGLLDRDEQMALLVQRVSGSLHDRLFYPQAAGVGFSFNPYVWHPDIDPRSGVLRMVFGLGTRAVDRTEDDYTRVVALNAPNLRPVAGTDDIAMHTQRKADVLDLEEGALVSLNVGDVLKRSPNLPRRLYFEDATDTRSDDTPRAGRAIVSFSELFANTSFVKDMRSIMECLQEAYDYPVDIEFTANVFDGERYRVNIVQCRPLQVKEGGLLVSCPVDLNKNQCVIRTNGPVIGQSRQSAVDWLIYVMPAAYGGLPMRDRHGLSRVIGDLGRRMFAEGVTSAMLIGPGRWGTASPELGVTVSPADMRCASAVCEIAAMHEGLVPDVSLGTHFFNDLVETGMVYMAVFPDRAEHAFHAKLLESAPNHLTDFLPDEGGRGDVLRVISARDLAPGGELLLYADSYSQRLMLCVRTPAAAAT